MIVVAWIAALLSTSIVVAQYPTLVSIEGIQTNTLFYPLTADQNRVLKGAAPAAIAQTSAFSLGRPFDGPLLPPTAQRVIYKVFNPYQLPTLPANPFPASYVNAALFANFQTPVNAPAGQQRNELIILRFAGSLVGLPLPNLVLQQPNLDVDPYICGGANLQMGACRCVNRPGYAPVPIQCVIGAGIDVNAAFCLVPTTTYFPFAPIPGENPYMRTFRRICLQTGVGPGMPVALQNQLLDTQLWYSVQQGCIDVTTAGAADPQGLFRCQTHQVLGKIIDFPVVVGTPPATFQPLPLATGSYGFINPTAIQLESSTLGPFLENSAGTPAGFIAQRVPAQWLQNAEAWNGETLGQKVDRLQRDTCCGFRVNAGVTELGVCINPTATGGATSVGGTACCGTKPIDLSNQQCCTRAPSRRNNPTNLYLSTIDTLLRTAQPGFQEFWPPVPTISHIGQPCPCNNVNQQVINGVAQNTDCTSWGVNTLIPTDNQGANTNTFQNRFQCCIPTKFQVEYPNSIIVQPIFNGGVAPPAPPATAIPVAKAGFCWDTTLASMPWRCCEDGNIFEPAQQQCCRINGVQSTFEGCPCEIDADCSALQPAHTTSASRCCKQRFPNPRLQPESKIQQCNPYANFPTPSTLQPNPFAPAAAPFPLQALGNNFPNGAGGNAPTDFQRCTGRCIDPTWQICCNGAVCVNQYERCCNDTCCNLHSQTCVDGYRAGSFASRFNANNFNFEFEICSTIEAMNGRRAFNIFIVPVFLLFATVASLALLLTFTRRAVEHVFELTERAIVFFAAFSVLIATVYFFSPMYKFGITIIWINLALIAIAAIRSIRPAILAVILQFILILYIIDPFPANHWFGMSHGATGENELANPNDLPSSLFETSYFWWKDRGERCVRHFDYFHFDFNARDTARYHNPAVKTFGYCSREWISVLMIFAGLLIITELLLLLLVIYSLVKLLGFKPDEVVQLEVRAEPGY
jgi:hypothetical protein